jgi:hypothetical protein
MATRRSRRHRSCRCLAWTWRLNNLMRANVGCWPILLKKSSAPRRNATIESPIERAWRVPAVNQYCSETPPQNLFSTVSNQSGGPGMSAPAPLLRAKALPRITESKLTQNERILSGGIHENESRAIALQDDSIGTGTRCTQALSGDGSCSE